VSDASKRFDWKAYARRSRSSSRSRRQQKQRRQRSPHPAWRSFSQDVRSSVPWLEARFIPKRLLQEFLEHYSRRLNAVEIKLYVRRLAALSTLTAGSKPLNRAPFVPRQMRISISRKLRMPAASRAVLKSIDPLRSARRLGPILFQYRHAKHDLPLLAEFLCRSFRTTSSTPSNFDIIMVIEATYKLLADHKIARMRGGVGKMETPEVVTSDSYTNRLRKPEYSPEIVNKSKPAHRKC